MKRQNRRGQGITTSRHLRVPLNPGFLPPQTDSVRELWRIPKDEILVDGPVNCGKTGWILLMLLGLHQRYPAIL